MTFVVTLRPYVAEKSFMPPMDLFREPAHGFVEERIEAEYWEMTSAALVFFDAEYEFVVAYRDFVKFREERTDAVHDRDGNRNAIRRANDGANTATANDGGSGVGRERKASDWTP